MKKLVTFLLMLLVVGFCFCNQPIYYPQIQFNQYPHYPGGPVYVFGPNNEMHMFIPVGPNMLMDLGE